MITMKKHLIAALAMILVFLSLGLQISAASWEPGLADEPQEAVDKSAADAEITFADEALALVNAERVKAGLAVLEQNAALKTAANQRAQEASSRFSHVRPNGKSAGSILKENKLSYKAAGENLALGYTDAAALVQTWMNSKAHKNVILSTRLTHGELGYFQNADGKIFCALLLYTPFN